MDYTVLRAYGIDYERGIRRCMGSPELYQKMLVAFLEDDAFARAQAAYQARDYQTLFIHAHELKGACGNADFFELFQATSGLVELLRGEGYRHATDEQVKTAFAMLEGAYDHTHTAVCLALGM